jgi:hypothetical protein
MGGARSKEQGAGSKKYLQTASLREEQKKISNKN